VAPGTERTSQPSTLPKVLGRESSSADKKYFNDLLNSPFGNELVWEAARRVLAAEKLGADEAPDLLCLGLSSNDIVGHAYGPDSDEVMDCTLRTDRQLADFLTWLDERVGSGKFLVALSADHGVGPLTEQAMALGLGGGRLHSEEIEKFIENALRERYASAKGTRLVREVSLPWIYLDEPAIKSAGLELNDVARTTARTLGSYGGIEQAFAMCDLPVGGAAEGNDLIAAVRNGYFPGRSGQVYAHWSRYWYKGSKLAGHGAAYDYDQHVPVMFMGPGIKPGRFTEPVSPAAMAATICAAVGIAPPGSACAPPLRAALSSPAR
jgi:predicted AlkP superfamily pyrophosphatase or phosphodiesterase